MLSEAFDFKKVTGRKEYYQRSILQSVEQIGNLEVVRYNFQEITELSKQPDYIDFKLFQLKKNPFMPDAKAVLISEGSATGCLDLTKIQKDDIKVIDDTLYVSLPDPELCNFKIDMKKSRIYDLQIQSILKEQKSFLDELYKTAEADIKNSALEMGILEQSRTNAINILKLFFEQVSEKPVVITFSMSKNPAPNLGDQ